MISLSAFQRFASATVIEEWAKAVVAAGLPNDLPQRSTLASRISVTLQAQIAADPPSSWNEVSTVLDRIQADCQGLYGAFGQQGKIPADKLPSVPSDGTFTIRQAQQASANFDALARMMGKATAKEVLPALEERRRKILTAVGYFEVVKGKHDRQVYAAIGGALVALRAIPAKITPVIRSITNSIKVSH